MSKLVAGQEVDVPGFIVVSEYGTITHCSAEMTEHGYVTIMPYTLKFTVPNDFNPIAAEVAAIEKKLDVMADDYHKKVRNLNDRIQSLLCIEMSPKESIEKSNSPTFDDDDLPF